MTSTWAGVTAFRETFLSSRSPLSHTFQTYAARQLRYEMYWAFFENSAYRRIHLWAPSMLEAYGLYEYTRSVYNPAFRLGSFWQTHLMGGTLDPGAGDGKEQPSSLPILCDNQRLRPMIAQLWRESVWQINKDVFTLYGTVMGDVGLRVIDDTARKRVYLNVVHPGSINNLTLDELGNVKGYTMQEERWDPRYKMPLGLVGSTSSAIPTVLYTEIVERDGDFVVYATYLNGQPWAWAEHVGPDGVPRQTWAEAYGFVPLVMAQHINIGADWGWAEFHPTLPKIREADDLVSLLDDQIRKTVRAKWAFIGNVKQPTTPPTVKGRNRDSSGVFGSDPEPGRDEDIAFYLPAGSDVKPMVAPLDIQQTSQHIQTILQSLEQDHPELNKQIYAPGARESGRAIRIVREPVEEKAQMYRPHYDNALTRALQMAISIGGMRGYPGYQGITADSYKRGDLALTIGGRPVFADEPADRLEVKQAFWTVVSTAVGVGGERPSLGTVLTDLGWSQDQLDEAGIPLNDTVPLQAPVLPPDIVKALSDINQALGETGVPGTG